MKWLQSLFALLFFIPPAFGGTLNPIIAIYGGSNSQTQERAPAEGVDVYYPSIDWYQTPPWLAGMTKAAHEQGIKVYPSLAAAYDASGGKPTPFAAEHSEFWEKRKNGTLLDSGDAINLSWGYPQVRQYKVEAFTRLVRESGVDGILLDYTRFFGNDSGYSPIIVEAFRKKTGRDPMTIPTDDPQWIRFRAGYVTKFVRELKQSLSTLGRKVELIACVNPESDLCLNNNLQDWKGWLDQGLIDGVTVMVYERDTNNTMGRVHLARETIAGRVPLIAMICPEYDNLPTPQLILEGSRKALRAGADGVAYYHEGSIIRLNLWEAIGEVARWDLKTIQSEPVNLMLNGGFDQELQSWAVGYGQGVRVENGALRMELPSSDGIRQVADRGLIEQGTAIEFSAKAILKSDGPAQLVAQITLSFEGPGKNVQYRVPLELRPGENWQQWSADMNLPDSAHLKSIQLYLHPTQGDGACVVDDVSLKIIPKSVPAGQYAIPSPAAIDPPKGVNVARGQVVRGTSFWENGFDYDNAVDGDLSSENYGKGAAWHSQRPAKDQSITIYLDRPYRITKIRLLNASAMAAYRTDAYKLEVSADGKTFYQVASGRLPDDGTTWTEIKLPPTPASLIRFTGVRGFNLDYAVGLKEIEVY
ncbi:MAG: family 10 glycosylhydrolase [Phycisphaerales bacterium]|nr:family 10 glycosylhydrolase [Phycisphaerales bacterium]